MERTASLFRNGRSQAIRIPREFELPGNTATIVKQADGSLVIRPADDLTAYLARAEPLPESDWLPDIEDLPPEPFEL